MPRSSRFAAVGAATVALAAGAYVGWPRPAQADVPVGVDTVSKADPVVLTSPIALAVGHRLAVELPVRTDARRDLLLIEAEFRTRDGAVVSVTPVAARLIGHAWRTVPFQLDVPDGAVTVELSWMPTVGPVEVGTPVVVSLSSSAEQPPYDD